MNTPRFPKAKKGNQITFPETKKLWVVSLILGALFWIAALILWRQQVIDEEILFFFNPMRIGADPIVQFSKWLSSYGMAAITLIFIIYLALSKKIKSLDAPLTIYFYTICSFGISGIVGDLLKLVFSRPRPLTTFGSEIIVLSDSATKAFPSGHATKSMALVLPFILLVSDKKAHHKVIKILIGLLAVGVCLSRIILGAHYLSDVIAGIGMAFIGLPFSMMFANMVLRKSNQEMLPKLSLVWGFLLIFLTAVLLIL